MLSFTSLPLLWQALQAIYTLLLFFAFIFLIIRAVQLRIGAAVYIVTGAAVGWLFLQMQLTNYAVSVGASLTGFPVYTVLFERLSDRLLLASLLWFTVLLIYLSVRFSRYRREHLTAMSVKEACDNLPSGLCYYLDSGRVILVNQTMNLICNHLTGRNTLNGERLWRRIEGELTNGILLIRDDLAYTFTRNRVEIGGAAVWELIATNISTEYELSRELSVKNEELEQRRQHLLSYGKLVEEYTIEKEMLSAKLRIHDDLGSVLLATKRFTEHGGSEESLLTMWNVNLSLLKNEDSPTDTPLRSILQTAHDLGFSVQISGTLPDDRVIYSAIRECMTNTIRHAGGNTLFIRADGSTVTFTNNGAPPAHTIAETGGLANLRHLAQSSGWTMTVQSLPQFVLRLSV